MDVQNLNYAAIALNLMIKQKTKQKKSDLRGVFYYAFNRILDEEIFDNRVQLEKYDKYFIDLYNSNTFEFQTRNDNFTNDAIMK